MRRFIVIPLAFACAAADCQQPATGQLGNVDYAWDAAQDGGSGWPLVAHGGRARMDLRGHARGCITPSLDVATVRVADPAIAAVILVDHETIDVVGGEVGDTTIELDDGAGHAIDRIGIEVAEVESLVPRNQSYGKPPPTTLFAGAPLLLFTTPLGGRYGTPMLGGGAVAGALGDGPLEVIGAQSDFGSVTGDSFRLVARGTVGSGGVTVAIGGASLRYPISVVDATAITAVHLFASGGPAAINDYRQWVTVSARANDVYVTSPRCVWSAPDGGPLDEHLAIDAASFAEEVIFDVGAPGSYTAVCTIGAASASVTFAR